MSQTILLFWSYSPEPAYREYVERNHSNAFFLPLRHFARVTMESHFPVSRMLRVGDFVHSTDRQRIYTRTIEIINAWWEGFSDKSDLVWVYGVYRDYLFRHLYSYQYWQQMVEALWERFPDADIRIYGPFSLSAINDGCSSCDVAYLEQALAAHRPRVRTALSASLAAMAGCLINRYPALFSRSVQRPPDTIKKTAVLVFGLQATDCKVQAPLMEPLLKRLPNRVRWLISNKAWDNLTTDEHAALKSDSCPDDIVDQLPHDLVGPYIAYAWRNGVWGRLSRCHVRDCLSALLLKATGDTVLADTVSGHVLEGHPDVRLHYRSVASLLDRYDPSHVVANSNYQLCAMVRGWTRKRRKGFIQLPHGVSYSYSVKSVWDSTEIFTLGDYDRSRLAQNGIKSLDRISSVGPFHLEAQSNVKPEGPITKGDERFDAVWLMSCLMFYGMPDVYHEMEDDVRMWARVLHNAGGRLVLRCHRRHDINHVFEHIARRCVEDGLSVRMSNPMSSLNGDLAASELAIVRTWGGAGLLALYAKTPVIGFMPRAGLPGSDDILSLLPLVARDEATSTNIVRDLSREDFPKNTILEQQESVLERLCKNPRSGQSYERAADLIVELVNG